MRYAFGEDENHMGGRSESPQTTDRTRVARLHGDAAITHTVENSKRLFPTQKARGIISFSIYTFHIEGK